MGFKCKVLCIKDLNDGIKLKKGKIYSFKGNEAYTDEDGYTPSNDFKSYEEWAKYNRGIAECFTVIPTYKVGDKAIVIKNLSLHKFSIGEIVTIESVGTSDYRARGIDNSWYVVDEELIPFKEEEKMITATRVYKMGDLVHCTNLSKSNVEGLVLGKKYRIWGFNKIDGETVYALMGDDDTLHHATESYFGYVTEPVNYPVGSESKEMVNHPDHYTVGGLEPIDYIKMKMSAEEFNGFLRGNVIKYVSRAGKKDNTVQDLKKAEFYLKRLIKEIEDGEPEESENLGTSPMTQKQRQFIAGLCTRNGIDRTNLPKDLSTIRDYHELTEEQATKLIEKLLQF